MKKFKDVELKYNELKLQLESAAINGEDMKRELKRLMVLDDDDHYWMIGGKTGKWYRYDGRDWKIGDPYKNEAATMMVTEPKTQFMAAAAAPDNGENAERQAAAGIMLDESAFEYRPTVAATKPAADNESGHHIPVKGEIKTEPAPQDGGYVCRVCQSHIPVYAPYCQFCGASQKGPEKREKTQPVATGEFPASLVIKNLNILALLLFCGGIGVIVGVIFGATFGMFSILGDAIYHFPLMLQETRGKIQGGLLFGALGGLGGFALFALCGVFWALFYNAIAFIFGGIRVTVKK